MALIIPREARKRVFGSWLLLLLIVLIDAGLILWIMKEMPNPLIDGYIMLGMAKLPLAVALYSLSTTLSALILGGWTSDSVRKLGITAKYLSWLFFVTSLSSIAFGIFVQFRD